MINFFKSVLLIALLYAGVLFLNVASPKNLTITMIDVGQGDGILTQNPDGSTCFFDGGSTDVKNLGKYRVEPTLKYYGVDTIDEWFVSHTDADHISALEELLENGYPIRHLYFAKGMVNDDTTEALIRLAQSKGTKVCLLAPGDRIQKSTASYTCIFPEVENNFTDKNDACLVIELKLNRFCALFTGDLTEPGETHLTQKGTLSHVNLLKVCHHGSKTSSSEKFLAAIEPDCAWISAGIDNSYGHPASETIEKLKKHTDRIYVTKESGAIRGVLKNNQFLITTFIQ